MLYELKIEFENKQELVNLIEDSYFSTNTKGKLDKKDKHLTIRNDSSLGIVFKGMHNMTVKLFNHEIIQGNMRFMIEEHQDSIKLYPCSIYCIMEDEKYSFF